MSDGVREAAHAKLNLRLKVLAGDGGESRAVETILLRLELADRVELGPAAGGIELDVETAAEGAGTNARAEERVARDASEAARRFHEEAGEDPGVAVRLLKRIPPDGGLGGSGADAAAVLRGLSRLLDDPLPSAALLSLAAELGGDAAFALLDRPMALAWGPGDRLLPLDPPPPRPMLLLVPETPVSAADARGWLAEDRSDAGFSPGPAVLPRPPDLSRWDALLPVRGNDFEAPVFARRPALAWWKEELLGEGAEAVLLCGTGATVCGIFAEARRRDAAADRLRESGEVGIVTTRGPV